jgi:hypothetical protein
VVQLQQIEMLEVPSEDLGLQSLVDARPGLVLQDGGAVQGAWGRKNSNIGQL